MTFQGLQQQVYRRLGYPDAPPAEVAARVKDFLNERYHQVLSAPGMRRIREVQGETFTTTANVPSVALAPSPKVARVLRVYEATNDWSLSPRTLAWYRQVEPDPTATTGTPEVWVPVTEQTSGLVTLTLYLWPTPDSALTYSYDYEAVTDDLSANGDVPAIPVDFHDVLVVGAQASEYEYRDQMDRMTVALRSFERRKRELRVYLNQHSTRTSEPLERPSRLGAWFPAGT